MQNNGENCETCRPDGLKLSTVNGVTRVEVPQDFGFEDQGGIGPIVQRAMAVAEQLQASPSAAAFPNERPFIPVVSPLEVSEVVRPDNTSKRSHPIRSSAQQLSTADSWAAEILGLGPPKSGLNNQFSTAQSAAADVLGLVQQEAAPEAKKAGIRLKGSTSPFPNVEQKPRPPLPTRGGSLNNPKARFDDLVAELEKNKGKIFNANQYRPVNPDYKLKGYKETEEEQPTRAALPTPAGCDKELLFQRTFKSTIRGQVLCREKDTGIKWAGGEPPTSIGKLPADDYKTARRVSEDLQKQCEIDIKEMDRDILAANLAANAIDRGLSTDAQVNAWETLIAHVAEHVKCPPECVVREIELLLWHATAKASGLDDRYYVETPVLKKSPGSDEETVHIEVAFGLDVEVTWKVFFSVTCKAE